MNCRISLSKNRAAAVLLAAVLACWTSLGQAENSSSLSAADQEFLKKAALGGMTEVALGKLAQEKGSTPDIRDFGKMMEKDHSKLNSDVAALAKKKDVQLPETLDEKHQGKVDKLSGLSGKDFDSAYLAAMHTMHDKDLAAFKATEASTKDADLKATLQNAIPVIESHIQHLKNLPKS